MKSLQQAVDDILERQWTLKICAELLDEKLRGQGIRLSKSKLNKLAKRVLDERKSSIDLKIDEPALAGIQIEFTKDDGRKAEEEWSSCRIRCPGSSRR